MNTQTANTTVTDETITYAGAAKSFAKGFVIGAVQVTAAYVLAIGALTIGATYVDRLFR